MAHIVLFLSITFLRVESHSLGKAASEEREKEGRERTWHPGLGIEALRSCGVSTRAHTHTRGQTGTQAAAREAGSSVVIMGGNLFELLGEANVEGGSIATDDRVHSSSKASSGASKENKPHKEGGKGGKRASQNGAKRNGRGGAGSNDAKPHDGGMRVEDDLQSLLDGFLAQGHAGGVGAQGGGGVKQEGKKNAGKQGVHRKATDGNGADHQGNAAGKPNGKAHDGSSKQKKDSKSKDGKKASKEKGPKWAGGAFLNSPPPESLPMPSSGLLARVRSASLAAAAMQDDDDEGHGGQQENNLQQLLDGFLEGSRR